MPTLSPPLTPTAELVTALRGRGYAVVDAAALAGAAPAALAPSWEALPFDAHLKDVGRYRRRRHACFTVDDDDVVTRVPHRAHWQPVEYNALHGGMLRMFEPIDDDVAGAAAFVALVRALARVASELRGKQRWFVEAHQFRIEPTDGIGRPTPEGAHRDGVDVVAVVLVGRRGIRGGETRVFDADGPAGVRFTLTQPWTALVLDDARVIHETTPVVATDDDAAGAARDTLVITLRAGAFQGPAAATPTS